MCCTNTTNAYEMAYLLFRADHMQYLSCTKSVMYSFSIVSHVCIQNTYGLLLISSKGPLVNRSASPKHGQWSNSAVLSGRLKFKNLSQWQWCLFRHNSAKPGNLSLEKSDKSLLMFSYLSDLTKWKLILSFVCCKCNEEEIVRFIWKKGGALYGTMLSLAMQFTQFAVLNPKDDMHK